MEKLSPASGSHTSREVREQATFSTLTPNQKWMMQAHWEELKKIHGLKLYLVDGIYQSFLPKPGIDLFKYTEIALDPVMHTQPGEERPTVTTICGRLHKDCMYLESRSLEALQFLHWKHFARGA